MELLSLDEKICRICRDPSDDLIAPCKCSGSVKFAHAKCLKEWIITNKLQPNPKCEICDSPFLIKSYGVAKKCSLNRKNTNGGYYCKLACFLFVECLNAMLLGLLIDMTINDRQDIELDIAYPLIIVAFLITMAMLVIFLYLLFQLWVITGVEDWTVVSQEGKAENPSHDIDLMASGLNKPSMISNKA